METMPVTNQTVKTCVKCGQGKPLEEYARDRSRKDGLHPYCKACMRIGREKEKTPDQIEAERQYQREYAKTHSSEKVEKSRRYVQEHADKVRAYQAQYRERNRETALQYARQYNRARYQSDPSEYLAKWHRRQARKRQNGGAFTAEEWRALCEWFGNTCLACGASAKLTVDHVIPLINGGRNGIENIQPLCPHCNYSKQDKALDHRDPDRLKEFLVWLRS